MKSNLLKFLSCIGVCALVSLGFAFVSGGISIKNFSDLGTYVGIVPIIMASTRLFGGAGNDALEDVEHQQRVNATFSNVQPAFDYEPIRARLPAGVLFAVGLFWIISMQLIYHFLVT
jgi:hypothetical protein